MCGSLVEGSDPEFVGRGAASQPISEESESLPEFVAEGSPAARFTKYGYPLKSLTEKSIAKILNRVLG